MVGANTVSFNSHTTVPSSMPGGQGHGQAVGADSKLLSHVEQLLQREPILRNAYFTALRDGTISREMFLETQVQFFFAVRFFPRPMAALMSRIPDSAGRMPLIHNLAEEHGAEEESRTGVGLFCPERAHDRTFLSFLDSMGATRRQVREAAELAAVRGFNLGLFGACAAEPVELAFACLGIIEYAFAEISAEIGRTVIERGWVDPRELVHYTTHAEIDRRHAAEFFHAVGEVWTTGGPGRDSVASGLRLGHYLFDRLYADLLRDAQRGAGA